MSRWGPVWMLRLMLVSATVAVSVPVGVPVPPCSGRFGRFGREHRCASAVGAYVKTSGELSTRTPMMRRRAMAVLAAVAVVMAACGSRSAEPKRAGEVSPVDVAGFGAQFDAGLGHRRLVLLMSPT